MNQPALWRVVPSKNDDGSSRFVRPSWLRPDQVLEWLVTKDELIERWQEIYPYDDLEMKASRLFELGPTHDVLPDDLEIEAVYLVVKAKSQNWPDGFWSVDGSSPLDRPHQVLAVLTGLEPERDDSVDYVVTQAVYPEDFTW